MAANCISLEEVIHGHEGSKDGIGDAIDEAKDLAKADDNASSMHVVISLSPHGSNSFAKSGQPFRVVVSQPNATIIGTILKKLRDDPSDVYSGKIRIVFRSANDSENVYKTYTRTMRSIATPAEDGGSMAGSKGEFAEYVKPIMDQIIQMNSVSIERDRASAQLVSASAQVASQTAALTQGFAEMTRPGQRADGSQELSPLLRMFGTALGANSGSMPGGPAGKAAAAVASSMIAGGAPPPSPILRATIAAPPSPIPRTGTNAPGSLVPTSRSTMTEADFIQWAKENPSRARTLGLEAWKKGEL